jgi:hypothetical protein
VRVRIGFDASTGPGSDLDPRILPDMGVSVAFLNEPAPEPTAVVKPRLVVPKAAVRTDGGQSIVFVVREDRVERRAVSVGRAEGEQVEVLSGVEAGDRVVVEGPEGLADGTRVKER